MSVNKHAVVIRPVSKSGAVMISAEKLRAAADELEALDNRVTELEAVIEWHANRLLAIRFEKYRPSYSAAVVDDVL